MKYVVLINKSKGTNMGKVDLADSFMSRFMGLDVPERY